jgi:hypothetical protein
MNRLFVLNMIWKPDTPNNDIGTCLLDMQRSWIKDAFWDVNNKKWLKWCNLLDL